VIKETTSDRGDKICASVTYKSTEDKNSSKNSFLSKLTLQVFSRGFQTEASKIYSNKHFDSHSNQRVTQHCKEKQDQML